MRTFERFLHRRRIKDVKQYFVDKGITTDLDLAEWCAQHDVDAPAYPVFLDTPSAGVAANVKIKLSEDTSNETWHVPAAERPLRKSVTKKSTRQKKKNTK